MFVLLEDDFGMLDQALKRLKGRSRETEKEERNLVMPWKDRGQEALIGGGMEGKYFSTWQTWKSSCRSIRAVQSLCTPETHEDSEKPWWESLTTVTTHRISSTSTCSHGSGVTKLWCPGSPRRSPRWHRHRSSCISLQIFSTKDW